MKWLFFTLVALNLIVFAGMLARKIYQPAPVAAVVAPQSAPQQPSQVIINTGTGAVAIPSNGGANTARPVANAPRSVPAPRTPSSTTSRNTANVGAAESRPAHRACSARVSMPADDYHRIKGLLNNFPHAATSQVVQGGGEGNAQSSTRMNVLFMNVTDQDASAIQAVVGRYGQLNRTPCNQ
ncbi:hypothetical protein [Kingella kingae]|uniref:hypothetical protein n=1 Tax=Kingella kingae TaxID=504 RepID=UPI00040ED03F|nr:hypothetical protein [Kingella kingae]